MPHNWDDVEGWTAYYDAKRDQPLDTSPYLLSDLGRVESLVAYNVQKIWFPGCGLDVIPHIFAHLGFEVWATDVSPSAIEISRGEAVCSGV